jgi:CMP-N,N'-diacetyllegionaminic acid synthase
VKRKIAGLIPARGGSKGVPGKNLRLLAGKPLIAHTIDVVLRTPGLCRIIVSTDDPEISKVSKKCGVEVPFQRPEHLASDTAAMMPVVMHAWDWLETQNEKMDGLMLLQPTSPFRTSGLLEKALKTFNESDSDVLVTLSESHQHPWWMKKIVNDEVKPFMNDCMAPPVRRQDLPKAYMLSGAIFIWSREALSRRRGLDIGGGTQLPNERVTFIKVDRKEGLEIDSEFDFTIAELIAENNL